MAITQTTVIREVLGPRSEGTGYNTLKRHYGVLNMRWLLTIISLFALAISVSVPAWAFDETHLKKLKALNACVACDLSKAILVGANLSKADLRAAWFSNANLSRANLSGANLVVADLSGANLSGANLNGANLGKASLHGANLSKADLSGADLWGANLSGVDLSTATLRNAKLDGAILCKTKMPWGEENSGCKKVETPAAKQKRLKANREFMER